MSQQNIYALLVGIDKYLPPVPSLDGCVNDMRAIRDFLIKRADRNGIPLHLEVLENDQATRVNIVTKFETHLTKAGKNDIAFFYYSGHGSQENAHKIFWPLEEDHKNETLVCYDSRMPDGMDLADKELATLIEMVAEKNPHILFIADCCNSGGNTRDLSKTKKRQVETSPAVRSLDSYILKRNIGNTRSVTVAREDNNFLVPNPRHVAFAAADSSQLAKETDLGGSPRGVFTFSLLEILEKSVGNLSYDDLIRRVSSLVKQRTYDQEPKLAAVVPEDANLAFLDGATTMDNNYFLLSHSRENGWSIDGGGVHGLMASTFGGTEALLSVYPDTATKAIMDDPQKALGNVSITEVSPTESMVAPQGGLVLDIKLTYKTKIVSLPIDPLKICIRGENDNGIDLARKALEEADSQTKIYLEETFDQMAADYNLIANDQGEYVITRRLDEDDQPLVEQISGFTKESAEKAIEYLTHIAKWEKLRELDNPTSGLDTSSIKIEIMDPEQDVPVDTQQTNGNIDFTYGDGEKKPSFRVKVVNTSSDRLYCALIYLSSQFAIQSEFIHRLGGLWLDPGAEVWAGNGGVLQGEVPSSYLSFGRNSVNETFKIIFSTKEFNPRVYNQVALNLPKPKTRSSEEQKTRGFAFVSGGFNQEDWNASELTVTINKKQNATS
ncbi:MAG: caspase family protein [Bacteroidetes bacterium]|nr:caspase family protein [Bacteroidota bacterium]MCB0850634.1 caspase family protein [Bacteroidota bacterium]